MNAFAALPPAERALIVNEATGRLGLVPLIVEKDFWVCWTLARTFEVAASMGACLASAEPDLVGAFPVVRTESWKETFNQINSELLR